MNGFAAAFSTLADPRRAKARKHKLLDILTIAFCACLCGAGSCVDRADFAAAKEEVLREFPALEGGPPSRDTFSRIFRLLDPARLAACFQAHLDQLGAACRGRIALDGETWRGAHDRAAGVSPLQMVSAFASETRLTLGQAATDGKSNEIPAVRELLSLLSLDGCTVTLDALHARRRTAPMPRDQGAHYVMTLKGNQGTLREEARALPEDAGLSGQQAKEIDAGHGRLETREAHLATDIARLQEQQDRPGPACVGKITATRANKATGAVPTQDRYHLLSRAMPAQEFPELARARWTIENSLPWVLDVVLREDHARARKDHAPANLALPRRPALNTIKANQDKGSNRLKFKRAGWEDCFLRKLLAQC